MEFIKSNFSEVFGTNNFKCFSVSVKEILKTI